LSERIKFTIRQLVAEYRALRASVLRLWSAADPAEMAEPRDIGRFNEAIDQALAESVDRYVAEVDRWRHVFLGVLGHDLRGPLNAILLTSQVLSAIESDTPASQHATRLMRSGQRMKELLDDLLDYSRTSLELGIPVAPRQCDLAEACKDEIDLLRVTWPEATIEFVARGSTTGAWDPSRVKQVLSNLVTNAVKYGDKPGSVVVTLDGTREPEVQLRVQNTGPTIAKDVLRSLFDPMRRSSKRNPEEPTSLGLGLFIVRQIALAHGGRIDAESADGRTVFTVVLPRNGPPEDASTTREG
jgi:signal transduction histidine kinase